MIRIVFFCFIMITGLPLFAQTEATQYFMKSLPQVSSSNPAFTPTYNYSIGLPGISSIASTYSNNGFSYKDLIVRTSTGTRADVENWNSALTNKNYVTTTSSVDVLRVGFRVSDKLYFQISSTARQYARLMLPRELTSLIAQGNAPLVGTTTTFSPQAEGTAWLESGISAALKVNRRLTVGLRLKYLTGFVNATTDRANATVTIADNYSVTAAADVRLRTAGVYDASQSGYSFFKQVHHYTTNSGGAVDLGASYQLTDKLTLAASLIDLGQIGWRNNTYDYVLNKETAKYTFTGLDADKLVHGNSDYLGAQGDSIKAHFKFQKTQTGSYTTWLPGRAYVSASYQLAKNLSAGLLVVSDKYRGRFSQSVSASVSKNFGRVLSTTVSYTVSNRSFNNFGAGLSLNLRPFQFYVVGDNLINAPVSLIRTSHLNSYINSTQVFSLRAGLNIIWGREKSKAVERRGLPVPKIRKTKSNSGFGRGRS